LKVKAIYNKETGMWECSRYKYRYSDDGDCLKFGINCKKYLCLSILRSDIWPAVPSHIAKWQEKLKTK
jgi:hypothetical protein